MKKGDILLIAIAVVLLILWLIPKPAGGTVTVTVNGEIYKELPLFQNCEFKVETEFGKNTVVIKNGEVFITHADCSGELCEKDRISKSGQSIVCLPNRLSVTIEGEKNEEEIDVVL